MQKISILLLLCALSITVSSSLEKESYFIKANLWEKSPSGKQNSTLEFLQVSCGISTCYNTACCGSGIYQGCCGTSSSDICCSDGRSCCPRSYATCCGDYCCNPNLAYCSNGIECLEGSSASSIQTTWVLTLTTLASLAAVAGTRIEF